MTMLHLAPGRIVGGRFSIQAELGRNSISVTYRAITAPNREVALRLLDPAYPDAARIAEALRTTHAALHGDLERFVTPIVDSGQDAESGAFFFVVPLVVTPSLAQLVGLCPFEPVDAAAMVLSLGRALDALHARGVSHHALKPTNVFVGPAPERGIQLTDISTPLLWPATDQSALQWLAPEQVGAGGAIGAASDVFTMALVAFHALTGTSLFPDVADPAAREADLVDGPVASKRALDRGVTLPAAVDPIFAHALAIDPAKRPPSAGAFAQALASVLDPSRVPAPAPSRVSDSAILSAEPLPARAPSSPNSEPGLLALPQPFTKALDMSALAAVRPPFPTPAPAVEIAAPAPVASPTSEPAAVALPSRAPRSRTLVVAGAVALALVLLGGGVTMISLALRGRDKAHTVKATPTASAPAEKPPVIVAPPATTFAPTPSVSVAVAPSHEPVAEQPAPVADPSVDASAPVAAAAASLELGPSQGQLTVVCEPIECDIVMLDGKLMSSYPAPVAVRAGVHGVGVSRKGFGGQWQQANVAAGERATVRFTIRGASATPSAAKKER